MVMEDKEFNKNLKKGVKEKQGWIRDAAGVLFRLHGMAVDGSMPGLKEADKKLLIKCKAKILEIVVNMPTSGHHLGAVYSQALAPWLCISQGGGSGELTMRGTVKDVGKAIVSNWKKGGKQEHVRR